jgi:outer membrane protein OmpA-like peptidoglycan-associated protein
MKCRSILAVAILITLPGARVFSRQTDQASKSVININVSGTIQTVNYWARGSTKVDFIGTPLLARSDGQAKVESRGGSLSIDASFRGLAAPSSFGPAYLVYVLWAITPEGTPNNLGQLILKGDKSTLQTTTKLQTFGMMVTAEPYFAVLMPSEEVVLENKVRSDTRGTVNTVNAKFDLLQRGNYEDPQLISLGNDPKVPLDLYQARNAVRIARLRGAEKYAPEIFAKATGALDRAEDYQKRKQRKAVPTAAREAVQTAEDALVLAVRREREQRIAEEQRAAQERQAKAQAAAEAEAQARAAAEQQQVLAERQRAEAETAAAKESEARAQAEAREKAAREQAESANQAAASAEREKQELRARLLDQFNRVLPTTDSPRGLVVNLGDVLFDTGKSDLRATAREALAKLSGIVLNYPTLQLTIEGHTDSVGSDEFNLTLSEKRADAVRDYLVGQGLNASSINAQGLGKSMPVADNSTAAGRQKNRRVEIIVSGEVIGTKIGN